MFIPFYGAYRQYRLANATDLFLGSLAVSIIVVVLSNILRQPLILGLLYIGQTIVTLVIQAVFSKKLADAFGKSASFALGLFFLPPVFLMILAFGDARYLIPAEDEAYETDGVWVCPYCETENSEDEQTCSGCGERRGRKQAE